MTIWILEDDEDLLNIYHSCAKQKGYQIILLRNLDEAWEMLASILDLENGKIHHPPDVVLSDFHLKTETALLWLIALRETLPKIRITCISGSVTKELKKNLINYKVEIRQKPLTLAQIMILL